MFANKMLVVFAVGLVVLSMVNSVEQNAAGHFQTIASPTSVIYDSKFIAAMNSISALVPAGRVIVVSTNAPFVTYFTGHNAKIPFGASSNESLVKYMKWNHYEYLVVFENHSQVPELQSLFSSKHVRSLESSFRLLGSYRTDSSQIYLYQLRALG
jgi:hypothetical protein